MSHANAHANSYNHGFIQLHLVNTADAAAAIADITGLKAAQPDIKDVQAFADSIFVYVEWSTPPLHVPAPAGTNTMNNMNTPAHQRVQALRTIIEVRNKPNGTPFYQFGLSHNWCCYGDT